MAYQVDLFEPPPPPPPRKFDFGENCPVPGYFPSGGGDPQKAWDEIELIRKKDVRSLQAIKAKWYCYYCESWHDYDAFFFQAFDGVYPHELGELPDHEWHGRFGGWEGRLRNELGCVGMATRELLTVITYATYYAYWAEGVYERDIEEGR